MKLVLNELYRFIGNKTILVYIGKQGLWHQFAIVARPNMVWAEVLERDLNMLEVVI